MTAGETRASGGPPVEALVFDVGGVLVGHDNALLFERLASRCDVPDAADRIAAALQKPHWENGTASIPDFHARFERELGYAGGWAAFLDDWCCHFTPDPSMLSFVESLSADHRVVLFSNTNKEHWDHLLARTQLGRFERFLSYEMGLSKPSVGSFALVADKAGLTPSRSLFFDDRLENVEGARRAGFRAEVFRGQPWLEDYLVASGIRLAA